VWCEQRVNGRRGGASGGKWWVLGQNDRVGAAMGCDSQNKPGGPVVPECRVVSPQGG